VAGIDLTEEYISMSFMASEMQARSIIEQVGLKIDQWHPKIRESIEFLDNKSSQIKPKTPPPIGTHLLMGDNAGTKVQNILRNLREGRLTIALGMVSKK
jgi:hypothetical protein